jgi:2-keto-4-pentenoate hydratase/2-oxohepta-3-ene-1,7-dioic acid hydratase in catechol pathway
LIQTGKTFFKDQEETMKLMRFVCGEDRVRRGLYEPERLPLARVVEGDLFGKTRLSKKTVEVKRILAPLDPPNVLALGLNYRSHADEFKENYPEVPILFLKGTNSVIGPGEPILLPKAGPEEVDYEAELAVVIGKAAKNVSRKEALDYVFGYTCANDVSARDWQIRKQRHQWARGKSFDSFCPLGPCIVTKEEIPDPANIRLRAVLNGEVMQDSTTAFMIFDVASVVSDLSRSMTLLPGTVIMTGTPDGVGFTRKPPVFLKEGDTISIFIDRIGELTNPVIREP